MNLYQFQKPSNREEMLRRSIKSPSEEMLAVWAMEDKKKQFLADRLKDADGETADKDFPDVKFSSEIRIKK